MALINEKLGQCICYYLPHYLQANHKKMKDKTVFCFKTEITMNCESIEAE